MRFIEYTDVAENDGMLDLHSVAAVWEHADRENICAVTLKGNSNPLHIIMPYELLKNLLLQEEGNLNNEMPEMN